MDKKFINKNNLKNAVERFQQIAEYKTPRQSLKKLYEYSFVGQQMLEDDQDGELQQPNGGGGQDMQNPSPDAQNQGGDMGGQPMGQMPPGGSQMPPDGMNQDAGMGGDMNGGADMGGMPPMDGGGMPNPMDGANGEMPQDAGMGDAPDMGDGADMGGMPMDDEADIETEEMEPDDEVIDVDELTQSQEATEYKIDGVDDRLSKIFAVVQKFSDQLDKQERSIMNLKQEFEKRNPTPEEKLNIRSQASYPYSELPKDYWDKKAKDNPYYNVMYDNDVSPSEEQDKFEISKDDISGLNLKDISDTLDIDQKLSDYIGF